MPIFMALKKRHCLQCCSNTSEFQLIRNFVLMFYKHVHQYVLFVNFRNDMVPIVMGGSREDYFNMAPPNSYIHVDDFASPGHLAKYLRYLDRNDTAYASYFAWKGLGSLTVSLRLTGDVSCMLKRARQDFMITHKNVNFRLQDPLSPVYRQRICPARAVDVFWDVHFYQSASSFIGVISS